MKKLIWVVTITGFCILACKKKEESKIVPIPKKYEYKRTSGTVTKMECGDVFVDTGGTIITVFGKGFDPKRKNNYILNIISDCAQSNWVRSVGGSFYNIAENNYKAELVDINDSLIRFRASKSNIFTAKRDAEGRCWTNDSAYIYLITKSIDSTYPYSHYTKYDSLSYKALRNQIFYHITSDILRWHLKSSQVRDSTIAIQAMDVYETKLYIGGFLMCNNPYVVLEKDNPAPFDILYLLGWNCSNGGTLLQKRDGYYSVSVFNKTTGEAYKERHGKKGVYVKFIN